MNNHRSLHIVSSILVLKQTDRHCALSLQKSTKMISTESQIKSFYKKQTLFLTGGSGFVGKVLLEKLLRECEDIEKMYVLLRSKKGKTPEERFNELFSYACFDVLKSKNKSVFEKVVLINGDCQKPFLGMSDQDMEILKKETTCVIHAAANVKFEQSLKEATCNVRATRDLLELAKGMINLKAFVFVSTAYSNCIHSHIKEEFYEPPMTSEDLFALVDALKDDVLQAITPHLLGQWPNTYIFTKSITENLIKTFGKDLPITIVRPAIIINTVYEPFPGWIDNFYGVCGIVAGAALGVIRSLHAKPDATAPMVPVDYVSNCILAAAWRRAQSGTTTIYNYVGFQFERQTWSSFMKRIEPHCWTAATEKVLWYYCFTLRENKTWHKICVFFLHTVPAYLVDFILFCMRRPTIAVENYKRLNKMLDLISYFSTRNWTFDDRNVSDLWNNMNNADRKLFGFDMSGIDVDAYALDSIWGARQHLLKDTPDTVPKGRRKIAMLFVAHYTIVAIFYFLVYKMAMFLLNLVF